MLNNPNFSPFAHELCLKLKFIQILTPPCFSAADSLNTLSSMCPMSILQTISFFFLWLMFENGNIKIYSFHTIISVEFTEDSQ